MNRYFGWTRTFLLACLFVCSFAFVFPASASAAAYQWRLTEIATEGIGTQPLGEVTLAGITPCTAEDAAAMQQNAAAMAEMVITSRSGLGTDRVIHAYQWSALPLLLTEKMDYPIEMKSEDRMHHQKWDSLLMMSSQRKRVAGISAGGFNNHKKALTAKLRVPSGKPQEFKVTFVVRDTSDNVHGTVSYTYTREEADAVAPVVTPVQTADVTPVPTDTPAPAATPEPTAVPTPEPTAVPTPEPTAVPTPEPTPVPTDTPAPVETPAPTATPAPTEAPAPMAVETPALTAVETPAVTLEATSAPISGATPTPIPLLDMSDTVVFDEVAADLIPAFYRQVQPGLWQVYPSRDMNQYRVYVSVSGEEPAFYPADAHGVWEGSSHSVLAVDDFEQYVRGFIKLVPTEESTVYTRMSEGMYAFVDRGGNTILRVYGSVDGAAPAYYPADVLGGRLPDSYAVTPEEDFAAHILGFGARNPPKDMVLTEEVKPGLWRAPDAKGKVHHVVYGALDGTAPAFYAAGEQGELLADAEPFETIQALLDKAVAN